MESLPDDVWHKILQIGVETERLDSADLCSLAIVNKHFDQLTQDPSLWAILLSRRGFPFSLCLLSEVPSKALYKREHKLVLKEDISSLFFNISWPDETVVWIYPRRSRPSPLQRIPLGSNFYHLETHVNSESEADSVNVTARVGEDVLALHEEGDPVLSHASHARLIQGRNRYYENKSRTRFNKMSRPKVIPNCKSYIPMNRPPRRSMPRKF